MRNIILNKIYITTHGKEVTPIEKIVVKNEETKFLCTNGNIIKKSKLWFIKGENPPKRPTSTI
jgi:hypothetical protein